MELSCTWHCKLVENVIFDSGIVKKIIDICVKLLGSIETDNILLGTAEDRSWNICAHEAILVHWKENLDLGERKPQFVVKVNCEAPESVFWKV